MAAPVRKYDTLPDLDSAPDTYETPGEQADVTEPSSPTASATRGTSDNGESASSSDNEASVNGEAKSSRIDKRSNRPGSARNAFSNSRVDARNVDFSDRITDGRKSYRVTAARQGRRRRKAKEGGGYVDEYGEFSDEEDTEETFAERIARLRREVEEAKAEGDRLAKESAADPTNGQTDSYDKAREDMRELGELLSTLHATNRTQQARSTSRLPPPQAAPEPPKSIPDLPSTEELDRILTKAADFESRLTLLEAALGTNSSSFTTPSNAKASKVASLSVLNSLSILETQLTTLSTTTLPSIESMSRQIHQLTNDATQLEEARSAARAAQEALAAKSPEATPRAAGGSGGPASAPNDGPQIPVALPEDAEQLAKVNALYGTLASIEAMAPVLPAVLDRLQSLRVLHADAAVARENLESVEKAQARMDDEIRAWREGLERAESAFRESGETAGRNAKAVEGWVGDLVKRMEALEK